jgi:hypothetical protein
MGATIVGNLFSSFWISKVSLTSYYITMSCFGLTSLLLFCLLTEPKSSIDDSSYTAATADDPSGLTQVFKLLATRRMLICLPFMLITAISTSVLAVFLVPLISDTMLRTPGYDNLEAK